jgi:Holliday junction resolvasome RuvABC ATP-dependent DNA helicase subunit
VIKEAFSDMLISIDEIHTPQKSIQDQLYQTIRDRYIRRVRAAGPTVVNMDT